MKSKNIFDLDPERLGTTDENGNRVYLYPEDVKGVWKDRRTVFYWFLILLYLVLPWFYLNGKPLLMINLLEREFTFFGYTYYGVEPILIFLVVATGLFFIGLITSLFGRVWCGWACPQTVFIQSIFMKIESLIEGKARERRELDKSPWGFKKVFKRTVKWIAYLIVSLHIAHTFVGYFIGPRELFYITLHSPFENWGIFLTIIIITSIFLLDFGWFREQFCIIACPYGRMQSVIMDENSLVISYDVKRGEPRRGTEGVLKEGEGDCINCYNCVKVCPTGIDIRRGTQLECIACTQCIDACDDIMTKLKRPKGLIKYSSENGAQGKKLFTPRSLIYSLICLLFMGLFFYFLNASTNLNMVFIRSKIPFQVNESGRVIVNHFTLKVSHQGGKTFQVDFKVDPQELAKQVEVVTNTRPAIINLPEKKFILFFKFPPGVLIAGTRKITVSAIDSFSREILATTEVTLVGPAR